MVVGRKTYITADVSTVNGHENRPDDFLLIDTSVDIYGVAKSYVCPTSSIVGYDAI